MGWIGVDLDRTLAEYHHGMDPYTIGDPLPEMVNRVKSWIAEGKDVRVFTARVAPAEDGRDFERVVAAIEVWCYINIGHVLPITCTKDHGMVELWDDRVVTVEANTGRRLTPEG